MVSFQEGPMDSNNDGERMPSFLELRKAVPKHCFEISLSTSMYYFLRDYAAIIFLYLIVGYVEKFGGLSGLFIWFDFNVGRSIQCLSV
jgi:fatty acid desaturase